MEVDEEKVNTYNISVGVCLWSCMSARCAWSGSLDAMELFLCEGLSH
jgi:hypothetical protein